MSRATTYTTRGDVRGECGHRHRTIAGAVACIERDRRGCERRGGYSDRRVVRLDGADLSRAEREEIAGGASW